MSPTPTIAATAATSLAHLPASASSLTSHAASTVGELVNAGVTALASPITTASVYSNTTIAENANVKSMFFKGINTFKDQSKDKFSNFLLTNKGFKK